MPLISSKGVYGLGAMHELAKHEKDTPVQIREISANADIPQNYLEQLLNKLKKAGLVNSIRGSRGGYMLASQPKSILVKEILIALEGDIKVIDAKTSSPVLNIFFEETATKVKSLFDMSLADFGDYQQKYNENLHYSI